MFTRLAFLVLSLAATAAGAACNLLEQLEGSFSGARIGVRKAKIGVDNADERHVGKVMTFCN